MVSLHNQILQNLSIGIAVAGNDINVFINAPARSTSTPLERTRPAVLQWFHHQHFRYTTHYVYGYQTRNISGDTIE